MQVRERGHIYKAAQRTSKGELLPINDKTPLITFVSKEDGHEHPGTTTQEMIRVLLDRTRHCANCMPHPNNERIIYHLRMALTLHEARALERKVEKGDILPEYIQTGGDGHFKLTDIDPGKLDTTELVPHRQDWDRVCNHPK